MMINRQNHTTICCGVPVSENFRLTSENIKFILKL